MPITPSIWLEEFQANNGIAATGYQTEPKIIGLANGNFLVAWEESSDGQVTEYGGIVGVIFNARGNIVRDAFQLDQNIGNSIDDFDIAATNDGGFVLVYAETHLSSRAHTTIHWQRFDDTGDFTSISAIIADEMAFEDSLMVPQVAVDLTSNTSIVTYMDEDNYDRNISAVTVSADGVVSPEFDGARNSSDNDVTPDVAVLANGNFVSAYMEEEGGIYSIEYVIMTPNGDTSSAYLASAGSKWEPKVSGLADGGFVITWMDAAGGDGNISYRIFDFDGSPRTTTMMVGDGADQNSVPNIVGLPDGGFFIVWVDNTENTVEGARFDQYGNIVGDGIVLISEMPAFAPQISLSGDGRLLVSWWNTEDRESYATILDPRTGDIDAADYGQIRTNFASTETITGYIVGSAIIGDSDHNVIFGQGGNDTLEGGTGNDMLDGGNGTDTASYAGAGSGVRVTLGTPTLAQDTIGAGIDTLISIEALHGSAFNDHFYGSEGADTLLGDAGHDKIRANGGSDRIEGGIGNDWLFGGHGWDTIRGGGWSDGLFGENGDDRLFGDYGNDQLNGGTGNDSLDGGNGNDILIGNWGKDNLTGGAGVDTFIFENGHSSKWQGNADIISDFSQAQRDIIDLSAIDAIAGGHDDAFSFVGDAAFSGTAGELRYYSDGGNTFVAADIDGDGVADLQIRLQGSVELTSADFLL